ncbi:MAG: lipopolysaccharide biosynthesis protein [Armatimonadota bacterium]|nr:lipopolysaccharide biosynthesis protein [Armatimonadota bacterium]MDR7537076.1 lipopolysaccharide biosynthesis protein [Armatimonadota bacterium]
MTAGGRGQAVGEPHNWQRDGVQVVSYWVGSLVPMAMALIGVAVFTRLVDVEDYGRFMLVTAATGIVITVLAGWGEYAVLRMVPEVDRAADRAAVICAVLQAVLRPAMIAAGGVAVLGLVAIWAAWLPGVFRAYLLPAVCLLVVRPAFQILRAVYQASGDAPRYAAYEVIQAVLAVALGALLVWLLRLGMAGRLWAEVTVLGALSFAAARSSWSGGNTAAPRGEGREEEETVRRALRVGLPVVAWFASLSLLTGLERGILRVLAGDGAVGSYGAIYGLVERTSTVTFGPLLMVSFPRIVKAFVSHGSAAAGKVLGHAVAVFGAVAFVYVALGVAFGGMAVRIIVPDSYLGGLGVIPWLLVAFVIWHFAMYAHKGLELGERMWTMLGAIAVAVCVSVLGCVLLVPRFGIVGVGIARVLASLAYLAVVWRPSQAIAPWVFKAVPSGGRLG